MAPPLCLHGTLNVPYASTYNTFPPYLFAYMLPSSRMNAFLRGQDYVLSGFGSSAGHRVDIQSPIEWGKWMDGWMDK